MKRLLYVVGLLAFLVACQDSETTLPDAPDTTAPTLVSQMPLPDAENVAANAAISVTFSEAIKEPGTWPEVTSSYVSLTDANNQVIPFSLALSDTTLTIQPLEMIVVPTKLTLTLKDIPDLSGNALAETIWSWFVPASNYGNAVLLGEPNAITDARLEERPAKVSSDADGNTALAYLSAGDVIVKTWNGTTWQQLGSALGGVEKVYALSLQIVNGQPVVAFQEGKKLSETQNEPNGNIFVYRWTGSDWQATTQADTPERDAAAPSLAVAEDGTLTLAYFEFDGVSSNVVVKRWDGSVWQPLGDALDINPDRNAVFPSLQLDDTGNPVVAWYEDRAEDLSRNVYVKRWTGTAWEQLGASLNINQQERADTFDLETDSLNRPIVAFSEYDQASGSNNIYVKRWNGAAWEQVGTVVDNIPSQRAIYPSVVVDAANQISVAWYEAVCETVNPCGENDSVYLARWDGSAWQQLGIQDTDAKQEGYYPNLSMVGNALVLAWIEGKTQAYQIFVKQYTLK